MSKNEPRNPRLGVVGGQAVLEGVMMRHGERYSVSVRKEDGSITTENRTFVSVRKKIKLLNIPLLRGQLYRNADFELQNALHLRRCLRPNRG